MLNSLINTWFAIALACLMDYLCLLVPVYCYFCIPFQSGWCIYIFCILFKMLDIRKARALHHGIQIFVGVCFCILVDYLCQQKFVLLSSRYHILISLVMSRKTFYTLCTCTLTQCTQDHLLFYWSFWLIWPSGQLGICSALASFSASCIIMCTVILATYLMGDTSYVTFI